MRPSGMSETNCDSAALGWRMRGGCNGAAGSGPTRNASTEANDGAPPTTRIVPSSKEATAAVVLGVESRVSSNDHRPRATSNNSTVGNISARPNTSSQPPTAAKYWLPTGTTLDPALAIWRSAQGFHWFFTSSYTSQLRSVCMKDSRGGAPTLSEQPPTAYTRPPRDAQPCPHRATPSEAISWLQVCARASKTSQLESSPFTMPFSS
mmetsp:Transcript_30045/g.82482  ORF Transcript_30045/g.82482 Transcript_30045/m.82482 type:complete len:207 (+) Transcript_30045:408-1028(+)